MHTVDAGGNSEVSECETCILTCTGTFIHAEYGLSTLGIWDVAARPAKFNLIKGPTRYTLSTQTV